MGRPPDDLDPGAAVAEGPAEAEQEAPGLPSFFQ